MVIYRYYNEDGTPAYLIYYKRAVDGNLRAVRLVYPRQAGFVGQWDKATDPQIGA